MKRSIFAAVVATAIVLWTGVVFAQKGQGPKAPKTQSAPKTHVTKTSGPAAAKPAAAQGPKTTGRAAGTTPTKTKAPKTTVSKTTSTTTKPAKTTTATAKPSKKTTTTTTSTAKPSKKTTTTTTSTTKPEKTTKTTTTTTTLTPVQQKLQKNTNLASKLQSRLPDGTNLMKAAEGFRNLGQFVAAVNVSNNLDISFAKLKTEMVTNEKSLGQAIQIVRADTDGTVEARRATTEADRMIADAEEKMAKEKRAKAPRTKPGSGS